jgi:hypothetical protein
MSSTFAPDAATSQKNWVDRLGAGHILLLMALLLFPVVASGFFLTQIGGYSLIFGMLALSLMILAGYGGMVSLAQITVAGIAAYAVAIFGENNSNLMGFGWPWWLTVPVAVLLAALASALIGLIAVRTEGIYTIMITLAIATRPSISRCRTTPSSTAFPATRASVRRSSGASIGAIQCRFTTCVWGLRSLPTLQFSTVRGRPLV